jgi:hypothetical protein
LTYRIGYKLIINILRKKEGSDIDYIIIQNIHFLLIFKMPIRVTQHQKSLNAFGYEKSPFSSSENDVPGWMHRFMPSPRLQG